MTDRIKALTVVLDRDYRTDDAEELLIAVRQLKGVLSVTPMVSDSSQEVATVRARQELVERLWAVLKA